MDHLFSDYRWESELWLSHTLTPISVCAMHALPLLHCCSMELLLCLPGQTGLHAASLLVLPGMQ